ncbi:MAG: hypothetical protein ACRDID_02605 [Ktedonobacterales bacterium]
MTAFFLLLANCMRASTLGEPVDEGDRYDGVKGYPVADDPANTARNFALKHARTTVLQ